MNKFFNSAYSRLIILLALSIPAYADCDFTDFPIMSDMKIYNIVSGGQLNNRPMLVKGFSSSSSLEKVITYYQRRWKKRFDESTYAKWRQISTMKNNCLMTVQLAVMDDGSQGRLVISKPPTVSLAESDGRGLLVPHGGHVVSDLRTDDGIKKGRVTILASDQAPAELRRFYKAQMESKGWSLSHQFKEQDSHVLVFRDGKKTNNVLIMSAGPISQILINEEEIQ